MKLGTSSEQQSGSLEKPHIDDKNNDLWKLTASYVDLLPQRHSKLFWDRAKPLAYTDKLNLAHYFELRSAMTSIMSSPDSIRVICEMRNTKMQHCNTTSGIP